MQDRLMLFSFKPLSKNTLLDQRSQNFRRSWLMQASSVKSKPKPATILLVEPTESLSFHIWVTESSKLLAGKANSLIYFSLMNKCQLVPDALDAFV
jgi:hypothetical protein